MKKLLKASLLGASLAAVLVSIATVSVASDHGDTPLLISNARHDARITDGLTLKRGDKLAFIIDTNPTLRKQTSYIFPTDVTFKSMVDNHTKVLVDDPILTPILGGTFADSSQIKEDVVITFTFNAANKLSAKLSSSSTNLGVSGFYPEVVIKEELVYVLGSGFGKLQNKGTRAYVGDKRQFTIVLNDNLLVFLSSDAVGPITIRTVAGSVTTTTALNVKEGANSGFVDRIATLIDNNDPAIAAIVAGEIAPLALIGLPVQTFSGPRDDMFVRGPQEGRNIAAMAVELPMSLFTTGRSKTLISWHTSNVEGAPGTLFGAPNEDTAGRSFGSMFGPEHAIINTLHPSEQVAATRFLGPLPALNGRTVPPDVIIFDTTKPQSFPNGRELNDDIIDLIAPNDARVNNLRMQEAIACGLDPLVFGGAPSPSSGISPFVCPTGNDVPHSATFPYLGLPHSL